MKVLIVSDTHRQNSNYLKALEEVRPVDMVIHCGDVEGSEYLIQESAGCPVEMVAGNNDFFSSLPREKEIEIAGKRVLLTHGHYYHVAMGTEVLKEEAVSRGIEIVMYGHTHKPVIEIGKKVTVLNPGSLTYPRQEGRRPSYMLMEIDESGHFEYRIHYI